MIEIPGYETGLDIFMGGKLKLLTDGYVDDTLLLGGQVEAAYNGMKAELGDYVTTELFETNSSWGHDDSNCIGVKSVSFDQEGITEFSFSFHKGLFGIDVDVDLDVLSERISSMIANFMENLEQKYMYWA